MVKDQYLEGKALAKMKNQVMAAGPGGPLVPIARGPLVPIARGPLVQIIEN